MSVHLLIDGYNLIRQSVALSAIDAQDIQDGRMALLAALTAYRRIKRHRITVVFDGMGADYGTPDRDQHRGITVVFSRRGETADQVIKRMARHHGQKAMVVTSDRDIASSAERSGCAVISAPAFEEKLQMATMMDGGGGHEDDASREWVPTTRKKGPARRLSKKQRRMQRKHRKL